MAREVVMGGGVLGEWLSVKFWFTFQNPWWCGPVIPALEYQR